MRSSVQKLLHPLCGRPIIAWTIAAAREAGAARIVLVDSPERRLEQFAGDDVELVVQPQTDGTAGAVRAAADHIGADDTVVVLTGDAPLVTADTITALMAAHRRSGSVATVVTVTLEDPSGYGRIVRAPDGTVERVVETRAPGDASEGELRIREINTGVYAFDGGPLLEALPHVRADNVQRELYLPDVLPAMRAYERTIHSFEITDLAELAGSSPRSRRWPSARSASATCSRG
jgi:bifunctional UDP-N-acetylglucosamine pyrophosphorylase/glucosamine-1-phosphate N-acetyltransferase